MPEMTINLLHLTWFDVATYSIRYSFYCWYIFFPDWPVHIHICRQCSRSFHHNTERLRLHGHAAGGIASLTFASHSRLLCFLMDYNPTLHQTKEVTGRPETVNSKASVCDWSPVLMVAGFGSLPKKTSGWNSYHPQRQKRTRFYTSFIRMLWKHIFIVFLYTMKAIVCYIGVL